MDPEETAFEKVRRAKIIQFMRPATSRPHKSVHSLASVCSCLIVFQLESIRGYSTTKDGHNRYRPHSTDCTTNNDQSTSHAFIRSAPIDFRHSRPTTPFYYLRIVKTPLRFSCSPRDTHACSCTSTATFSRCHKHVPTILPNTATNSCTIPTKTRNSTTTFCRPTQTECIPADTTTVLQTPTTAATPGTGTASRCVAATCNCPTPTTSTTNPTHRRSYTDTTTRCSPPVSCVIPANHSSGQLPWPTTDVPEEGEQTFRDHSLQIYNRSSGATGYADYSQSTADAPLRLPATTASGRCRRPVRTDTTGSRDYAKWDAGQYQCRSSESDGAEYAGRGKRRSA